METGLGEVRVVMLGVLVLDQYFSGLCFKESDLFMIFQNTHSRLRVLLHVIFLWFGNKQSSQFLD